MWSLKNRNCSQRGFTLIELLVVVGLLSVFSGVLFTLFRGANRSQVRSADDLQLQARVLSSQSEILRIIRDGKSFILPRLGETTGVIAFIDKVGDIQVIFPRKDEVLSAKTGKELFTLMRYRVDIKNFDLSNPVFKNEDSRKICEFIENVEFRLTSANSVSISLTFATENRQFQVMFEGGLMSSNDF